MIDEEKRNEDSLQDDSDADAFAVLSLMLIIALAVVYYISNQ